MLEIVARKRISMHWMGQHDWEKHSDFQQSLNGQRMETKLSDRAIALAELVLETIELNYSRILG